MEYIVNPLTKRKVSIYGKKGKEVLNQYINAFIMNGGDETDLKDCVKSNIDCTNKTYPCYNSENMNCCNRDTLKCIKSNFHPDNVYGSCVNDSINCTDNSYPCYDNNKNTCCSKNRQKCIKGNFHEDNLYGPCIKDTLNCSDPYLYCYNADKNNCCNRKKTKCAKGNFNLNNGHFNRTMWKKIITEQILEKYNNKSVDGAANNVVEYLNKMANKISKMDDIVFVFGAGNGSRSGEGGTMDLPTFANVDIVSNNTRYFPTFIKGYTGNRIDSNNFNPMWLQLDFNNIPDNQNLLTGEMFVKKYMANKIKLAYFDRYTLKGSSQYANSDTFQYFIKWFAETALSPGGRLLIPLEMNGSNKYSLKLNELLKKTDILDFKANFTSNYTNIVQKYLKGLNIEVNDTNKGIHYKGVKNTWWIEIIKK